MAEPVIVPFTLELTDIDTTSINFADAEKQISKSLSGIKKQIQEVFSGIDPSAINKPIEKSMTAVEKYAQTAEDAMLRYRESVIKAGKSTQEYKAAVSEANTAIRNQESFINELSQLGPAVAPHLEEARKKLDELIEARNKIDPVDFVDNASQIELDKVANTLKKAVSAVDAVNKKAEDFSQTAQDNRLSDEYAELLKQAEAYDKKLQSLAEKSREMEFKGATDTQWENLRKDAEWTRMQMDEILKQMRKVNKEGKAFRFGDGDKGEITSQIRSIGMTAGNRAKGINARAMKNESPYTEDYQKSLDELDKLEKKIEAIKEKSAKMIELGASKKQFQSVVYDAEQLDTKVDEVKNHLMNMATEGTAFKFGTGDADAEISKISDKSNGLKSTLTGVATNAKKAQGGLTALGATHPKLAIILGVVGKIASGFGKVLKVAGKAAVVIAKGFVGAIKILGKVAQGVGKVARGFADVGKRIFGAIKNLNIFSKSGHKTSKSLNSGFKKLGKNILMWGLGFRTAYYLIKRLRTVFIEGFKVMGDQFEEVGQPLMRMMESFNRLKGSLVTAFQPLVSVVIPILTQFMNYMSGVLESIGKFMATLTGQGHIYKAVAKDIDSVSGAAKEANKQLGSYDKLEVIKSDSGAPETGYDYEKQKIDATGAASKFAEMVKEAWKNADFTSVGVYVTEQLLGVLDIVEKNIVPKFTAFVNRLLKSVNTFIDGFDATAIGAKIGSIFNTLVDGLDWEQIGMLFANLYNIVWEFFDGLVNDIDWKLLGQSLATGVESLAATLNLDSFVGSISGLVNGITTALYELLTNVDWDGIATKFGENFTNLFGKIDVNKLGITIGTLLNTVTDALNALYDSIDWAGFGKQLGTALYTLVQSFDFEESGRLISNKINSIAEFIVNAVGAIDWLEVGNSFANGINSMVTEWDPSLSGQAISDVVTGLLDMLVSFLEETDWKKLGNKLGELLASIDWSGIAGKLFEGLGAILGGLAAFLWGLIESAWNDVVKWWKDVAFEDGEFTMEGLLNGILESLKNIGTWIKEHIFDPFIKGFKKAFGIASPSKIMEDMGTYIVEGLKNGLKNMSKTVTDILDTLKQNIKAPINAVLGFFEKFVNGVINALNSMVKAMNKLKFDVPDWVPGMGGKSFGFNIKELKSITIPRLAQGAVIPPNREFLAMLGDQKRGTNIEAPLDTIKQALAEVLAEVGGAGSKQPIVLQVNGRTLAQVVWDEQEKRYKQTGRYSMAK